jgi:hypothetical protein
MELMNYSGSSPPGSQNFGNGNGTLSTLWQTNITIENGHL